MGERWGKMGKKWVKNEITGLQKTALMHASAGLVSPAAPSEMYSQIIVWIAPWAMEERGCDVSVYFSVMSARARVMPAQGEEGFQRTLGLECVT